jgi:hypothetical protein
MTTPGTIRPNLNYRAGALSFRSIQHEPMAAFADSCPESRHSASGHDRLYGFAPKLGVHFCSQASRRQTLLGIAVT